MAALDYLDFDLQISAEGGGYRARVLSSPAGEAEEPFVLPFSPDGLENFVLKVGRTRTDVRRIGSPQQEAARVFGTKLFDALFDGEVRSSYARSLDEAERSGQGLRLRLRLAEAPDLADVPWEYMYSRGLGRFLALSAKTPVVRYVDLSQRIVPLEVTPPLRVLLVVAGPRDLPSLNVAHEVDNVYQALGPLARRGLVEVNHLETATLAELRQALRAREYHVLHFIGHGGYDEGADGGVLAFEDSNRFRHLVSGESLGTLLHDHSTLRLALLNACEGARNSRTDPFAGVAQSLVQQGIPAVIAMQFEITDRAAITFSREFYPALLDGYPVDGALAEARKAVMSDGEDIEWGTPVLYLRAKNAQIFAVALGSEPTHESPTLPTPPPFALPLYDAPEPRPATGPGPSRPGPSGHNPVQPGQHRPQPPPRPVMPSPSPGLSAPQPRRARANTKVLAVSAVGVVIALVATLLAITLLSSSDTITATRGTVQEGWANAEWADAEAFEADAVIAGKDTAVAATWRLMWDEDVLFFLAEVSDSDVRQPWASTPSQMFRGDSVSFELGKSAEGMSETDLLRPEDGHFLFGPNPGGGDQAVKALNPSDGTSFVIGGSTSNLGAWWRETSTGYQIEGGVSWNAIGISKAEVGMVLAANFNVSDVAADDALACMKSSNPDRTRVAQNHPALWQSIELQD